MSKEVHFNQLMDMLDNPQAYSEEEIRNFITDDEYMKEFYDAMVESKQSYRKARAEKQTINTDKAWQHFQQQNLQEEKSPIISLFGSIRKYAAIIACILLISGISYATILQIRQRKEAEQTKEITKETPKRATSPSTTIKVESADNSQMKPKVFDNVLLEDILPEIAEFYGMKVEFRNPEAKGVRLFFTWDPQESVDKTISKLNQFERLTVKREGENIIVE